MAILDRCPDSDGQWHGKALSEQDGRDEFQGLGTGGLEDNSVASDQVLE